MIIENTHLKYGKYQSIGSPFKFSDTKVIKSKEPPLHGEHTNEILKKIGYSDSQIDELRKNMDREIQIIEVDTHINTPEFARAVAEALLASFKLQAKTN